MAAQPQSDKGSTSGELVFITALRGVAPLLVVWNHYAGVWPDAHNVTSPLSQFTRPFIATPLGLIQDFGFLGVAIFFLISGYVITTVLQRESRSAFAIKRFMRIYPPMWLSWGFFLLVPLALGGAAANGFSGVETPVGAAGELSLLSYFHSGSTGISTVAWTLAIEVAFYTLCLLFATSVRKRPKTGMTALLAIVTLVIVVAHLHPGGSILATMYLLTFIPILVMGQILYYTAEKRISARSTLIFSGAAFFIFLSGSQFLGERGFPVPMSGSRAPSVVVAYAMFVTMLLLNDRLRLPKYLRFVAKISYSLYLLHYPVGFFILDWVVLRWHAPYLLGVVLAFAAAIAVAWVSWRLVERPSQLFARKLISKLENRHTPVAMSAPRTHVPEPIASPAELQ